MSVRRRVVVLSAFAVAAIAGMSAPGRTVLAADAYGTGATSLENGGFETPQPPALYLINDEGELTANGESTSTFRCVEFDSGSPAIKRGFTRLPGSI